MDVDEPTTTQETLDDIQALIVDKPLDVKLHAQHVAAAKGFADEGAALLAARELAISFVPVVNSVWLPLIYTKESEVDRIQEAGVTVQVVKSQTLEKVKEVLELYERAEEDYLSIELLKRHLEFLTSQFAYYSEPQNKLDALDDMFSVEWTRSELEQTSNKGIWHLSKSHVLWDIRKDWEMELLDAAQPNQRATMLDNVELMLLNRIQQPHANHESVSQSYSTFTTNYKPPQDYEEAMVAASKMRAQAVKTYDRKEQYESSLSQSNNSLDAFLRYIGAERRTRAPDVDILRTIYERAIAEAAKKLFEGDASIGLAPGEPATEAFLRVFWLGLLDSLRLYGADETLQLQTLRRAARSVPGCGQLWARYFRFLEATGSDAVEGLESVSETFDKALATNTLQTDIEQLIPVILARAGFERRRLETGQDVEEAFPTLIKVLEDGIALVRIVSPIGDPRLRLEKYLAEVHFGIVQSPVDGITVWQSTAASKQHKATYTVWISYTDALIKQAQYTEARQVFSDVCNKYLDWPEAVWDAWISFENLYGEVSDLEACLDKVEKAQYQTNAKRAREAEKAAQAQQEAIDAMPVEDPQPQAYVEDVAMVVDVPKQEGGVKRKAEESAPSAEGSKKARTEPPAPATLKRDRENSTVFVADLAQGVTDDELKLLFKDCGRVREVKMTQLTNALVATVEFFGRDSIPAALTKDKKRVRDEEISVHLAWKSTLYVTNFPEKADDASMRELFGQYGIIFDIRWPSKKFKNTRRFCYVQYTTPASAEKALQLHGHQLEAGLSMNVFISNPERKKERTDADANEREIYVAGLSKFTNQADLEKLFKTYGTVKEVRMTLGEDGTSKGFAFVEFEQESDAVSALAANNHELKKRRIAVTMSDSRVRARKATVALDTGMSQQADTRSRSIRVRNLPPSTQEGLLQQFMEKHTVVKRVEVFTDKNEAVVELESAAEVGKLLLRTDPIVFNGNIISFAEDAKAVQPGTKPAGNAGMFVPRAAGSRPRAGLGGSRKPGLGSMGPPRASPNQEQQMQPSQLSSGKGQDDFRKMLG